MLFVVISTIITESAFGTGIRCSIFGILFLGALIVALISFGASIVSCLERSLGNVIFIPGIPAQKQTLHIEECYDYKNNSSLKIVSMRFLGIQSVNV